jgi:PIN domain nuclease of toxin-antitoxin system
MPAIVSDTHAAVWYFLNDRRLSSTAQHALDDAAAAGDPVYLPTVSLVEVVYLVEKGKLPAVALDRLFDALAAPNSAFISAPLEIGVVLAMRQVPRDIVPDMPDRIIAATALHLNLPLVTRDSKISKAGIKIIW